MRVDWLSLLTLPPLALIGGVLLWTGMRGRRIAHEPRCRRCGHIVVGVQAWQCPECAGPLAPQSISFEHRKRRWGPLLTGLTFIAVAGAVGVGLGTRRLLNVHLARWMPFETLIERAEADDAAALDELRRRFDDQKFDDDQLQRVAAVALRRQSGEHARLSDMDWIDLLEQLDYHGRLPPELSRQYHERIAVPRLIVEAPLKPNDDPQIQVALDARASRYRTWRAVVRVLSLQAGPVAWRVSHAPTEVLVPGVCTASVRTLPLPTIRAMLPPGPHDVTVVLRVSLRRPSTLANDGSEQHLERRYELTARVYLSIPTDVPASAPATPAGPPLDPRVLEHVRVERVRAMDDELQIDLAIGASPVAEATAVDLFVRSSEREQYFCRLRLAPDDPARVVSPCVTLNGIVVGHMLSVLARPADSFSADGVVAPDPRSSPIEVSRCRIEGTQRISWDPIVPTPPVPATVPSIAPAPRADGPVDAAAISPIISIRGPVCIRPRNPSPPG